MVNWQLTKHFNLMDDVRLACPCCHLFPVTARVTEHMTLVEQMRVDLGFPIVVNSGYRCVLHNRAVGGVPNSQHRVFATDLAPESGEKAELDQMYAWADAHFTGIGRYDSFIHVDLREKRVRWVG